jgi:CBS domain containing-hemolysin-like protein
MSAVFWFGLLVIVCIIVQGLFAAFEMACVSFNKMRLAYYTSAGSIRAKFLAYLLQRPTRLFGTTLIGTITALQIGAECARRFYEALLLDPDWAPLTQIILVVVFAELGPMFTARRRPESIALGLSLPMASVAFVLSPVIAVIDLMTRWFHRHTKQNDALFPSREEVRWVFAERGDDDDLNLVAQEILQLKAETAAMLMTPLDECLLMPTQATIGLLKEALQTSYTPVVALYARAKHNIVGIIQVRSLLKKENETPLGSCALPPWFVTGASSVLQILEQFRRNNQSAAVILSEGGAAIGVLTLDDIVDQIFGEEEIKPRTQKLSFHIERTLSGDMTVAEFNHQFGASLQMRYENETLSDLIVSQIDHPPAKGEEVHIGNYTFVVVEPKFRGVAVVRVCR